MKKNWFSGLLAVGAIGVLLYIPMATQTASSQDAMPNPMNQGGRPVRQPKNIKVLKGLTLNEIEQKMKQISKDLGVKCIFCHQPRDYSADVKEEKETARKMLMMVDDIGTKYFPNAKSPKVTCYTCHRGQQEPAKQTLSTATTGGNNGGGMENRSRDRDDD